MQKYKRILAIMGLIVASGLFLSGCGCKQGSAPVVDQITIWGLWDESAVYDDIISQFRKEHGNVQNIVYKKYPCNESECYDYLREVVQGLAAGTGPDIFMINNTWVPAQKDKMVPVETANDLLEKQSLAKIMTLRDFGDTFVPVAKKDLVSKDVDGQERIYGVPLWIDNLAVFYNRDLFNTAGLTPPPKNWTWQQITPQSASFESYASKITKIDQYGNIVRAGAAMGYGKNVHRAGDILAVLMMQMGSPVVNEEWDAVFNTRITSSDGTSFSPGETALSFYSKFSDKRQPAYSWNKEQWQSLDDFTRGHLGMMINYSNQINTIKAKAPSLNFGIAHLPKVNENSKTVNFASYWALAVSKQATDQKAIECWNFLKFLTDTEQSDKYVQKTGRISPRIDLIEKQKEDQWLGVFADQAVSSDSFREANNARISKIFEDAINSIVEKGTTPQDAAAIASQQVSQEGYELAKKLRGAAY
jgi:multiple sugar transport system substrate-binding protein